ncbi:MAG: hypothetical protein J0I41_12295 [Filimonas sp.]|nr:hypothetical protein [Filimonas sp.]
MIKVLILDDNAAKAVKITEILNSIGGCKIETACDLVSARLALQNAFDLLILDMNLPERFNQTPKEDLGLVFVEEIKKSHRLKNPSSIIGLSEYEDIIKRYSREFEKNGIVLIKYDIKSIDWQDSLKEKVRYLVKSSEEVNQEKNYKYDVAIIAALRSPELDSVLELPYNWEKKKMGNDITNYNIGSVVTGKNHSVKIVATALPQMGLVAAAYATAKMIEFFRPKYIIMTGICGGVKGAVSLGDLVVCDFSFDLGSGKIIENDGEEGFEPDYRGIPISTELREEFIELKANKDVLRKIKDSWRGNSINGDLDLKIGPVGSGAAVIANSSYTSKIKSHSRKLVAIDMETYSIYYSCSQTSSPKPIPLSIKGVCDFADNEKNDNIQKYCSHISAALADHVIKNMLSYD